VENRSRRRTGRQESLGGHRCLAVGIPGCRPRDVRSRDGAIERELLFDTQTPGFAVETAKLGESAASMSTLARPPDLAPDKPAGLAGNNQVFGSLDGRTDHGAPAAMAENDVGHALPERRMDEKIGRREQAGTSFRGLAVDLVP